MFTNDVVPTSNLERCEKCNLLLSVWFRGEVPAGIGWTLAPSAKEYQIGGPEEYAGLCPSCFDAEIVGLEAKKEWWRPKFASSSEPCY